ncbi:MAG: hypothetical protein UHS32_00880 [Bacteroidaceae bacterium]|nr:hypothetical protein [Bacteroidaceae bacterium]
MNSKQFNKFYKNSAFKGKNRVRQSVIKSIVDKIAESFPDETSGTEISIALSIAIAITIKTIDIKDVKLVNHYLVLMVAEVKRILRMIDDHELEVKPINKVP